MKVVIVQDREYSADFLVAENVNEQTAQTICDSLNANEENSNYRYEAKPDDYVLDNGLTWIP